MSQLKLPGGRVVNKRKIGAAGTAKPNRLPPEAPAPKVVAARTMNMPLAMPSGPAAGAEHCRSGQDPNPRFMCLLTLQDIKPMILASHRGCAAPAWVYAPVVQRNTYGICFSHLSPSLEDPGLSMRNVRDCHA